MFSDSEAGRLSCSVILFDLIFFLEVDPVISTEIVEWEKIPTCPT